jgi:NAD(P)H-quinone oxidoreductase subunit 5
MTENLLLYYLLTGFPLTLGGVIQAVSKEKEKLATASIWIGWLGALGAWFTGIPFRESSTEWGFRVDEVSWIMASLILFVSATVHQFSLSFMAGDRNYRRYFTLLTLVTLNMLMLAIADNIWLFSGFWMGGNLLLVLLMMHKREWRAAKNSALLALATFSFGMLFLIGGMTLLWTMSGSFSLSQIALQRQDFSSYSLGLALMLFIVTAFTQSGGWPFHKWLLSSLNSPTPVSALMHAGLVNGSGLLLVRLAPLFFQEKFALTLLFIASFITLILGGVWKLVQSDIKRMLAASTMTQMGFMMMQCGLGLFPAALAHLCWHGLFKAYQFLRSGSILGEKREVMTSHKRGPLTYLAALFCGVAGAGGFALGAHLSFFSGDTTFGLILFSAIASVQLALAFFKNRSSPLFVGAVSLICFFMGGIYGVTVWGIEKAVESLQLMEPQPLTLWHLLLFAATILIWIAFNLTRSFDLAKLPGGARLYVAILNASQPHPETLTSNRSDYRF